MVLTVDAVTKHFGVQRVFSALTLHCCAGERVSILGPSGCGKSTLIKVIIGIERADQGVVYLANKPANDRRLIARTVSFMGQKPALLPWLSALDNVLLPIRLTRRVEKADEEAASELLDAFGISASADKLKRPWELSGGMKQRVSLAQALIVRGEILILDEPFSAIDDVTRRNILVQLDRWLESHKTALILVTHSFEDATYLTTRAMLWRPPSLSGEDSQFRVHMVNGVSKSREISDFIDPIFSQAKERLFADYLLAGSVTQQAVSCR